MIRHLTGANAALQISPSFYRRIKFRMTSQRYLPIDTLVKPGGWLEELGDQESVILLKG